mgnify:CR=1 FL=1
MRRSPPPGMSGPWASRWGTTSASTPRPPSPQRLPEVPVHRRQGERRLPAHPPQAHGRQRGPARYDTELYFTVYEEVGHGGATIPQDLSELLAVDMGCVGLDLTCTEHQLHLRQDSAGPTTYDMVSRLVALAREHGLDYAWTSTPTIPPTWRCPGRRAATPRRPHRPRRPGSHGMERTHYDGLKAAMELTALYLELA